MSFTKQKTDFLSKKDKSRKGNIDIKIKKLVDKINSLEDFYTTSSCAGRISLLTIPKSNKKNEVKYLFCSHKKIQYNEFKKLIKTLKNSKGIFGVPKNSKNFSSITKSKKLPKDDVWFRVEPVILHVACKNINNAKKLLNLARNIGFRRSGIISVGKNRIIMELIGTEKIDAIAGKNGKLLIDENYFKILIKEGNKKLEKTWEKINKLHRELKVNCFVLE